MTEQINWLGNTKVIEGDVAFQGTVRFLGGSRCVFADPTDSTKTMVFNLSGLTTGTETEFTVPESDSSIVTLSAVQTLTNKTLTAPVITGATVGTIDNVFTIADNATPTKIATFQCASLSTGTNVFTFPQTAADTLVCLATTQTLTAKTLTTPTINAGILEGTFTGASVVLDYSNDITLDAADDMDFIVGGDVTQTVTGNFTSTVTGAITITSSADVIIEGTGTGDDVILQAPFDASRIFINGGLTLVRATTAISASTSYKNILGVTDNSSGRTITLEADTNIAGRVVIITDEAGTAGSANNITITPESGTIDGMAGDSINTNYGKRVYYGDGTNWHSIVSNVRPGQVYMINANSRAGTTAGWADFEAQADNLGYLATLPAAQTASTLIVPVTGLKKGWILTGFYLIGQIEGTSGDTATLDADFRLHVAVAADPSDASLGSITQISVTADTAVTSANSTKTFASAYTILGTESFYVKLTGTTGAANDIVLLSVAAIVTET